MRQTIHSKICFDCSLACSYWRETTYL
ncbi:hypothetical protein CJF31_00008617 [Rutstroemia sp. NJR-2017a BVV2]|nr:hypothetical protein CJF31_00008617 [Rutstroemia sp. NJR-2017a BVV2]